MPKRILNFLTASAIVLFVGTGIRSLPVAAIAPAPHANPAGGPPDLPRRVGQPRTEGPGLAAGETKAPTSGLDSLLTTAETVAETWTDAFPDETGMRRRVRIAKAPAGGTMLRIEEEVRAAMGEPPVRVGGAMAAGHILVGSRHAEQLETEGLGAEPAKSPAYVRVRVPDPENPHAIPALIARLNARGITDVSPDGFARPAGLSGDPEVGSGSSWHLENLGTIPGTKAGADINAVGAWEHRTDASPVLIALLDSGILHGEPDLAESIYSFPGETAGDGIDNDGNGYIDDVQGYDFADDDPDPTPANMHGTACASLIGARGGNGTRSSGIAWKASILNCKIYTSIGHFGAISDIIDAIDYSIAAGARIINLSWTYDTASPLLEQALSRASQAGVILVCAAGNQIPSQLLSELPGRIALPGSMDLPLLVTVAASGPDDTLAPFTKVDPAKVDIAAPGVNIPLSLMGGGGRVDYSPSMLSGSSYATALVSGGLALAMAEHPGEAPRQILRRLLETADPVPGGAAMLSSGGRMNVGRMLTAELPAVAHDRFADRRILTDPAGQWTGSNTGAGIEPVDSTGSPSPAPARTLWFEWTAANSGMLTISAAMPQGSPTVRVFRSSGGAPAALAGQFLKGKPLTVAVTQGEKLFWMLDSTTPAAAGLRIAWQLPPSNDSIATAPVVTTLPAVLRGTTIAATPDKFEGKKRWHTLYYPGQSIWWKFVPDRDMEVVVSVLGDNCIAYLLPAKPKAASFPKNYHYLHAAGAVVPVQAGKTYAVLVVPSSVSSAGSVTLALTEKGRHVTVLEPQDVAALPGETVDFSLGLLGDYHAPQPPVQWFKNDQPVDPWTIAGIVTGDESYGTYHATLNRGGVIETTRKAVLSRRAEAPRLVEAELEHALIHGQHLALTPRFANPEGATFAWEKDGQPLAGETSVHLFRTDLTAADGGNYSLVATNAHGSTRTDFSVSILATPWKRWLQGDAEPLRGAILQVAAEGSLINALTPRAWLSSTDHGATWSEQPLPADFTATTAARLPDGTLLVSGSVPGHLYPVPTVYRKSAGGTWTKVTVSTVLPDGSREIMDPGQLFPFDGKIYARSYQRVSFSSDGISWTPLTLPGQPGILPRFTDAHRFGDSLVFLYWDGNSDQPALVLKPGGVKEIVPEENRQIWQVDGMHFNTPYNPWADFAELRTVAGGLLRGVSDEGEFFQVLELAKLERRNLGFTAYARTGNRWVLGYPDGTLWTGEDLLDAPEKAAVIHAGSVESFGDEFISGDLQSSDGIRWQALGPVTGEISARTRDRFFLKHQIPFLHHFDEENLGMTFSSGVHPLVETAETSVYGFNTFWSGSDSVLMTRSRTGGTDHRFVQILRPGPNGTTVQESDIGIAWEFVDGVTQIGGHWYVDCSDYAYYPTPILTRSLDGGVTWNRMPLMPGYRVTGPDGFHVAAGVSNRGFLSEDGVAWKPHLMRGLPAAPDQIVTYRGHFIARVGHRLYVSADGSTWHLGAADEPVAKLAATRGGVVALTTGGNLLHPDAAISSGPRLRLGPGYQHLSVARHQPFAFTLEAGDDDGDLVSVACYLDGQFHSTLTAAPFDFPMDTSEADNHAVEFLARDSDGRTSRTTAVLKITPAGVPESAPSVLEPSSDRFVFKGKLYTRYGLNASTDGTFWHSIAPLGFTGGNLVANDRALVAYSGKGIAVSHDGVTWTVLGGFTTINSYLSVEVHDNRFELKTASESWVSDDGLDWQPVTGTLHPSGVTWCDSLHGVQGSSSNWRITTDGGKNWLALSASFSNSSSQIVPVTEGYLVVANESLNDPPGVYFLGKNASAFTLLAESTAWNSPIFLQDAGERVFFGIHGVSLFSTSDGPTVTTHTKLPSQWSASYVRHGGEWLALTGNGFYASPDLVTWRLIYDTSAFSSYFTDRDLGPGKAYPHGNGSLIVNTPNFLRRFVVIAPDLTVTEWPYGFGGGDEPRVSLPVAYYGGKFFKDRVIAVDEVIHTKPAGTTFGWEPAELLQGEGYEPAAPHEWPARFDRYYGTSSIYAASDDHFLMLVAPWDRRFTKDVVIRSDDGRTFKVHEWKAPVTLEGVTLAAASSDTFLAATEDGRVLKSTDGLNWTLHTITEPTFSIHTLHHFAGRWHAAGYHPYRWVGGTQIPAWSEIWSSTDGETWQKSWEGREQEFTDSQNFSRTLVAHGSSWIYHVRAGWLKSSDGLQWAIDPAARVTPPYNSAFVALGEHPEGLIATHYSTPSKIHILDPATWQVRRSVDFGTAEIRPLDGWPFIRVPGNLLEWTEKDPRLTSISATSSASEIVVQLAAAELEDATLIRFSLSDDAFLGAPGDIAAGSAAWSAGSPQPDGSRRFTIPVPAGLSPGNFRVVAGFNVTGTAADIGIQNNTLATAFPVLHVPHTATLPVLGGVEMPWNDDPDGDGLTNWQEHLLGTDPVAASGPGYTLTREADCLKLTYQRPEGLPAASMPLPEYSATLDHWSPVLPQGSGHRVVATTNGLETVEITLPFASGRSGFIRLRFPSPLSGP